MGPRGLRQLPVSDLPLLLWTQRQRAICPIHSIPVSVHHRTQIGSCWSDNMVSLLLKRRQRGGGGGTLAGSPSSPLTMGPLHPSLAHRPRGLTPSHMHTHARTRAHAHARACTCVRRNQAPSIAMTSLPCRRTAWTVMPWMQGETPPTPFPSPPPLPFLRLPSPSKPATHQWRTAVEEATGLMLLIGSACGECM